MQFGNTNREVISAIKHQISEIGTFSDENSYSDRELYFYLLRYRSYILAQKIKERGYSLNKHNFQTIGCIPMDRVSPEDCPCVPESGKEFRRTRYTIPKPIGQFINVTSVGNHMSYDFIQYDAIIDLRESRFKAERNRPVYTLKTTKGGTYLFTYNDKLSDTVTVTGIFENPLEVQNFPDCETGKQNPCFTPYDEEFIIDPELLPVVYDMILTSKFKFKQPVSDIYNDDKDDTLVNKPPSK